MLQNVATTEQEILNNDQESHISLTIHQRNTQQDDKDNKNNHNHNPTHSNSSIQLSSPLIDNVSNHSDSEENDSKLPHLPQYSASQNLIVSFLSFFYLYHPISRKNPSLVFTTILFYILSGIWMKVSNIMTSTEDIYFAIFIILSILSNNAIYTENTFALFHLCFMLLFLFGIVILDCNALSFWIFVVSFFFEAIKTMCIEGEENWDKCPTKRLRALLFFLAGVFVALLPDISSLNNISEHNFAITLIVSSVLSLNTKKVTVGNEVMLEIIVIALLAVEVVTSFITGGVDKEVSRLDVLDGIGIGLYLVVGLQSLVLDVNVGVGEKRP